MNKKKPAFSGIGSKQLERYSSNRRAEIRAKRVQKRLYFNLWYDEYFGRDYYGLWMAYPITHIKDLKKHLHSDDKYNPENYHKISDKTMEKYKIHKVNDKKLNKK